MLEAETDPTAAPPPHLSPPAAGSPLEPPPRAASVSALLTVLGGLILVLAFFTPTFQGAYWLDDDVTEALRAAPAQPPALEARDALVAASALEPRLEARAADDEARLNEAVREHRLSGFEFMRFWQLADYEAAALSLERDERLAARLAWTSLALVALGGVIAVAFALGRGLRPVNAGQIAWGGLVGTVCLLGAVGMSLASETRQVADTMVGMFDPLGVFALGSGAAILLVGSMAGLSRDNWYKVPVAAVGWLLLVGALTGLPIYALIA